MINFLNSEVGCSEVLYASELVEKYYSSYFKVIIFLAISVVREVTSSPYLAISIPKACSSLNFIVTLTFVSFGSVEKIGNYRDSDGRV